MTVTKPIPCSIYDIPGLQEWLDEMALQGLFLKDFSRHNDRADFRVSDPEPVRYRLDPVSKNKKRDLEREEPYAEMGWTFAAHIPRFYYIFSCDDPNAPELYSDPQSLALAMDGLMRREVQSCVIWTAGTLLVAALPLLLGLGDFLRELLLWERPQYAVACIWYPIIMLALIPLFFLQVRRIQKIRSTLAQGLPLKAKRRWNRPRFYVWYLPLYTLIYFFPRLFFPSIGWEVFDLNEAAPSHPWPTIVQTEALGPRPLEMEPYLTGYATENSSYLAPVQEERSSSYSVRFPSDTVSRTYDYWTDIRYVQARSPKAAEAVFRVEYADVVQSLNSWAEPEGRSTHITDCTGFVPLDWPGVDRLEVARYRQRGLDGWTFAALRGTDILVVQYRGFAQPEDCIGLFLEALDREEAVL